MDPKDVGIRIDEINGRVLAQATLLNFSPNVRAARYMLARITYDMKSMMSVENNISAIETASNHSVVPIRPVVALCLMMDTFRERSIMVAPRRKLVMIVILKLAESTSTLGCSNCLQDQASTCYKLWEADWSYLLGFGTDSQN